MVSSGVEPNIFIRIGDSPMGPFGSRINVFKAPEWDTAAPKIYTYNAKAHPSLSWDGNWLVTYNVNTPSFAATVARADIYRPRFFVMRFEAGAIPVLRAAEMGSRWFGRGFDFSGNGMRLFKSPKDSRRGNLGTLSVDGRTLRLLFR